MNIPLSLIDGAWLANTISTPLDRPIVENVCWEDEETTRNERQ